MALGRLSFATSLLGLSLFGGTLVACGASETPRATAPSEAQTPKPAASHAAAPSPDERAQDLVRRMTTEEKIEFLGGKDDFFVRGVPRLGIPEIKMADGPVGCRNWGPSTAYPATIGLAASFDVELTERVGRSLARDCRSRGVHVLLAPGVNLQRSPKSGRNFEYFGEDPRVAAEHAVAFIEGVQSGGVVATVKHFALNDQEWDRNRVESRASERARHELYYRPFHAAVTRAKVGAVMTSYNLVDGEFATHQPRLLRKLLREEWGFEGLVMSDWYAAHDTRGAFEGGLDLEMPKALFLTKEKLLPLLESGELREADLDEKVRHILATWIRFGFLDRPQLVSADEADPESARVALEAARRSVVLLENRDRNGRPFLPLDPAARARIAVVGPNATPAVTGGAGSARVTPVRATSLLEGLRARVGDALVSTHPGIQQRSLYGVLGQARFVGPVTREIFRGENLTNPPLETKLVERVEGFGDGIEPLPGLGSEHYSLRFRGEIEIPTADVYEFLTNADDGTRVFVDGKKIVDDWTAHAPRTARGEVRLGKGRHAVVVEYFQGTLGARLEFGYGVRAKTNAFFGEPELAKVVRDADVVVVAVGFGQHESTNSLAARFEPFWPPGWARDAGIVEAENDDRPFELPEAQRKTLELVAKSGKPFVVVGMAGGGVDLASWAEKADALLWAWYPGQEGGTALAEVLFGEVNPSAKLPVTFARRYADHPAASSYDARFPLDGAPSLADACRPERLAQAEVGPGKSRDDESARFMTPYCEDTFLGYRGFSRTGAKPLYPFGFGLSYTTFAVGSPSFEKAKFPRALSVEVTNTGTRPGAEVLQLYAESDDPGRPPSELIAFARVELAVGETRSVRLAWTDEAIARFDETLGRLVPAEPARLSLRTSSVSRP